MVIGWSQAEQNIDQVSGSAWAQIEAAQRRAHLPCLLIPQPAHAVLAGEIAAQLTCFGPLPAEIIRAIQMHDTGWAASDAHQLQKLRGTQPGQARPVSFLAIPTRETEEAWSASIDAVRAFSTMGAAVVSRHFTLLAQHEPAEHRNFLDAQKSLAAKPTPDIEAHLDTWTAALRFCDLLSLYLLCGLRGEVELPLSHPSSQINNPAGIRVQIEHERIRFHPQAALPGSSWSIHALRHPPPTNGPRSETLTWTVA